MEVTVSEIIEQVAKHGFSEKTKKDWSMAKVKLSNGEEVLVFNPIQVGAQVKEVQNGEFKNWQAVKPDPKHDEIMNALRLLMAEVKKLTTSPVEVRNPFEETEPPQDTDEDEAGGMSFQDWRSQEDHE